MDDLQGFSVTSSLRIRRRMVIGPLPERFNVLVVQRVKFAMVEKMGKVYFTDILPPCWGHTTDGWSTMERKR